jgi:hypothetical protein
VRVTGRGNKRVSTAALIANRFRPPARLISRVHIACGHSNDRRKGFTEIGYARLVDASQFQGLMSSYTTGHWDDAMLA